MAPDDVDSRMFMTNRMTLGMAATFAAVGLLADEKLDTTGRRLAQLVFWTPALQLLFGNPQIPGPGFIAPAFAAYLITKLFAPVTRHAAQDERLAAAG